jgi:hypothetical protein
VKNGQHGRLTLPRDEARRGDHPERVAAHALDAETEVVGSTAASELIGQRGTLGRFDVEVGDGYAHGVLLRNAHHLARPLIRCQHAVVVQPAHDGGKRAHVEQLRERVL